MSTVFYSWQSDRPNKTCRNFIQAALKEAIRGINRELEVLVAERGESLTIDQDTKGVPGTPEIFNTILDKIEVCRIFAPDLTIVAKTDSGKSIPNPNVMVEYGWALSVLGRERSRFIPIMNTVYGDANQLPFDLTHVKAPIQFHLVETASSGERKQVKAQLVKDIRGAIYLIIETVGIEKTSEPTAYNEIQPKNSRSFFVNPGESLEYFGGIQNSREFSLVPTSAKAYLRLIPATPVDLSKASLLQAAQEAKMSPMVERGADASWDQKTNRFGSLVVWQQNGWVKCVTQLFRSGELWGLDVQILSEERKNLVNLQLPLVVPIQAVEKLFEETLSHYISVAQTLGLNFPVTVEAGLTEIDGYKMWVGGLRPIHGDFTEDVWHRSSVKSEDSVGADFLVEFLDKIWAEAGLQRMHWNDTSN